MSGAEPPAPRTRKLRFSAIAGLIQIAMGCALVPLSLRSMSMRLDGRYLSACSGSVVGPVLMAAGASAILLQLCRRYSLKCLLINSLAWNLLAFLACLLASVWQMEILPGKKTNVLTFAGPVGSVKEPETFQTLYSASIAISWVAEFFCFCMVISSSADLRQRFCRGAQVQR